MSKQDTIQDADEPFEFRRWARSVTYEKVHAAVYGAFLLFIAALASSAYVLGGFVAIVLWALGVRASPFRYTQSGDKKVVYRDEDVHPKLRDSDVVVRVTGDDEAAKLKPHKKVFMEIRHKPHYFIGGGAVGEAAGRVGYYLLHGTQPDHWEHLPEIVARLFLGVA